jgi:hypothetical protein
MRVSIAQTPLYPVIPLKGYLYYGSGALIGAGLFNVKDNRSGVNQDSELTMYGLPKDTDLSFFIGKTLESVTFGYYAIYFNFESNVAITIESSFQHQQKVDVEKFRLGVMQSTPVSFSTLMQLVTHSVASFCIEDGGTLALTFDDGQVLKCFETPGPYESYTLKNGEDEYIV